MIEEDNTLNRIKELKNYTPIKIILMVIVVLYHSMIIYAGGTWGSYIRATDAPILGYIAEWMNSFYIYAFTLISVYIFTISSIRRRLSEISTIPEK